MKKIMLVLAVLSNMLGGCQASNDKVELNDRFFVAQTEEIYKNSEDYLGKTIKYEGILKVYDVYGADTKYYLVIRYVSYGLGCCAVDTTIDASVGFCVKWDKEYPSENDWVEAVGVLEEAEVNNKKYLRIALTSLKKLPTRGKEIVFR